MKMVFEVVVGICGGYEYLWITRYQLITTHVTADAFFSHNKKYDFKIVSRKMHKLNEAFTSLVILLKPQFN